MNPSDLVPGTCPVEMPVPAIHTHGALLQGHGHTPDWLRTAAQAALRGSVGAAAAEGALGIASGAQVERTYSAAWRARG